jgi:hypothetical protein
MIQQGPHTALELFPTTAERLTAKLKTQIKTFFLPLLFGVLLALARRRTVTTWLRTAGLSDDYRQIFYHLPSIGRKSQELFNEMLKCILEHLRDAIACASSIRIVLDDSPTKRYGKKVDGAGYHHNPTPGKTDATLCFGHSWVVATLVLTHPLFGEISFPIAAELYLRKKEIDQLQAKYHRTFKTKTTMAVEMIKRLVPQFKEFEKTIEIIVDGGYAKDTVLLPLGKFQGVRTITRLRRDAALFEIPVHPKTRGRGRPKMYGTRIDRKSLVESSDGWQWVECRQYGQVVSKQVKSLVATSRLTRGKPIRVVIVQENDKTWLPLMSTNVEMSVVESLESYAIRFGIEEMFKDLKEVWGWGKQEWRRVESNEAATTMNMLLFGMTELATWDRSQADRVDRGESPWDDGERRPSHADRRNFLRQAVVAKDFYNALRGARISTKIIDAKEKLMRLAA